MAGVDKHRIAVAVAEILEAIGDDPQREGLRSTPARVADAYGELFSGIGSDPGDLLDSDADVDAGETGSLTGDLVLMRNIDFRSICEHHLLPFAGRAHVAYLPGDRIVGLGRLPRVIDTLASRPQLQERLTEEIADVLDTRLRPLGVLVVLDARHDCVTTRGARQAASSTVTVASRGSLTDPAQRTGVLSLLSGTHG